MTRTSGLIVGLRARIRAVLRRGTVEREMLDEVELHLERATERFMRRGMSERDARDAARREFGNVAVLHEEARDARGARWIESCMADVRFALRYFSRTPLTAITLVLVLALGIGVNSALFSILQTVRMRPAPGVPADDALVRVRGSMLSRAEGRLQRRRFSMPEVSDLATRRETLSAVAAYARQAVVFDASDGTDARPMTAHLVTPNYFAILGIRPALGPGLPAGAPDNTPGSELAVVIAHLLWEEMGADTAMIGRLVRLNGIPVRVVGVAAPNFRGPILDSGDPLLWAPLAARAALMRSTPRALTSPDSALLEVIARLAPGATPEQATSMVRVVATAWVPEQSRSAESIEYASDVVPLRGVTDLETARPMAAGGDPSLTFQLGALGTAALLVLLVACTNVSALMVGAAVKRRREIAIRLSLGASRRRVVRQLVTESSLIALAGGALGLTIYWWITWLMSWWMGQDMGVGPDLGTVGFTAFVALGTGIVFGLSPALHATRLDVATALKDTGGGTSRTRLQRVLIVAQIGLTQPLLVGIAMAIWIVRANSGGNSRETPLAGRVTRVEFGINGGAGTREAKAARIAELMKQVAALPGVEAVVPQSTVAGFGAFRVQPADRGAGPRAEATVPMLVEGTPPGYFAFHNTVMLRGRDLVASDTSGRDMAVVIDAALARGFWGPVDPIGKRLQVTTEEYKQSPRTAVVVGVFDSAQAPVRGSGRVYTADGARWSEDTYLVRTRDAGTVLAAPIRQLARTTLPDIPIYQNGIATLEQLAMVERREMVQVSAAAAGGGGLTLLLASIGLYGVVALAVRQRHREIGIRVALGARPGQVIGMFFASGLRLSVIGLVLGLPLSVVALYALASGIAGEPLTALSRVMAVSAGAIAVVVTAVASLATWIPARRAARVDALEAIRVE